MAVRALVRELNKRYRLMREGPDLNRTGQQIAGPGLGNRRSSANFARSSGSKTTSEQY